MRSIRSCVLLFDFQCVINTIPPNRSVLGLNSSALLCKSSRSASHPINSAKINKLFFCKQYFVITFAAV